MVYENAVVVLLAWLAIAIYVLVNSRKIGFLKDVPDYPSTSLPTVAIIVPIRNEGAGIATALESLARLDYPCYQLVLVNDGSTGTCVQAIRSLVAAHPHVSRIDIEYLPEGWIGKSYALYRGYRSSNAEWLLFTDADVRFEKDSLRKAIMHCMHTQSSHLTVLPHVQSRSVMVNAVNALFQLLFHLRYRPWATNDAGSGAYVGMGAFNLVRRLTYEAIGTHERFSLHPNDDLKLGAHIKHAGFRQEVRYGQHAITYEWYRSLNDFIQGLTKNAFSSVDYSVPRVLLSAVGAILFFVLPVPLMMCSGDAWLQGIGMAVLGVQTIVLHARRGAYAQWWYAFVVPFSGLVIAFIMLRSAAFALYYNGVHWSRRFYRLSDLKKWR